MPANSPVRYFLKVDGVIGDVTDKAHKGWFAVDGYDIGVTTPFSSAAGAEVTGRTQFSPLSVDIHSLTGVSALLADELTNKSISSVELVGVETTAKGTQQTVYDLKLTDALVGSFENDPGSKGVETALTFHYDKATLTDHSLGPTVNRRSSRDGRLRDIDQQHGFSAQQLHGVEQSWVRLAGVICIYPAYPPGPSLDVVAAVKAKVTQARLRGTPACAQQRS